MDNGEEREKGMRREREMIFCVPPGVDEWRGDSLPTLCCNICLLLFCTLLCVWILHSVLYLFVTEFVTLFFAHFCNFNWI